MMIKPIPEEKDMKIKGFYKCALIFSVFIIITSCGGGGGGGTDTATDTDTSGGADTTTDTDTGTINVGEQITVTGTLDELTLLTSKPEEPEKTGWFKSALRYIFPSMVNAQDTPATINRIIAIGQNRNVVTAARNQSQFSMNLDRENNYLVVFLNDAEVEGIYQPDVATDLDVLPPSSSATDIDLGTISLNSQSRRTNGTIGQTALFSRLGRSSGIISAIGVMDQDFLRLSSLDVDGNNILDFEESKEFIYGVVYQFYAGTFSSIAGSWSDKDGISTNGYRIFAGFTESLDLDWGSAVLHYPAPIDGISSKQVEYYGQYAAPFMNMDWYFDDVITPITPPQGTYIITIGSDTFTFTDVYSVTVDANLSNVYIPEVRLTRDGDGMVTLIEWQWWKKSDGAWEELTDEEMEAVFEGINYGLYNNSSGWEEEPGGNLPLTPSGSVVPVTTSFIPNGLEMGYLTKANGRCGYRYADSGSYN